MTADLVVIVWQLDELIRIKIVLERVRGMLVLLHELPRVVTQNVLPRDVVVDADVL